jgi:hypothetical protein
MAYRRSAQAETGCVSFRRPIVHHVDAAIRPTQQQVRENKNSRTIFLPGWDVRALTVGNDMLVQYSADGACKGQANGTGFGREVALGEVLDNGATIRCQYFCFSLATMITNPYDMRADTYL